MSSGKNTFEALPLELLRLALSFCSGKEIVLSLPLVSKRFYHACNDISLLRKVFTRELEQHALQCQKIILDSAVVGNGLVTFNQQRGDQDEPISLKRTINQLDKFSGNPNLWARWIIALEKLQTVSTLKIENISDFAILIQLMQFLPHALLLADGEELNLRMALCLTAFIMENTNISDFINKIDYFGDQSIAGWVGSAIIGSPDYMWLKNYEQSALKRRAVSTQLEPFTTIMGLSLSLELRIQHAETGIERPCLQKMPLFTGPLDMSMFPLPLDITPSCTKRFNSENKRGLKQIMEAQQLHFLEEDEISKGTWCGVYLMTKPLDVQEFLYGPPLRGIQFQSTKIHDKKWKVKSLPVEGYEQDSYFEGTMQWQGKSCSIDLIRLMQDNFDSFNQHWHGQLSPFGISGGFHYQHQEEQQTFDGGLFWLWKSEWQ